MSQPVASAVPELMMVPKAVAGVGTCTERLVGKLAAASVASGAWTTVQVPGLSSICPVSMFKTPHDESDTNSHVLMEP
jgi:hypothetical protein